MNSIKRLLHGITFKSVMISHHIQILYKICHGHYHYINEKYIIKLQCNTVQ